MITQQEVLNSLAQAEVVRFKEVETDLIYAATMVEGQVLVWPIPVSSPNTEMLSLEEFIERFDESYVI